MNLTDNLRKNKIIQLKIPLNREQNIFKNQSIRNKSITVEPGYNDTGLCRISSIASDFLWYKLIPSCYLQCYTPHL